MNKYISTDVKRHIVSALQTFIASFLVILGSAISTIDLHNLDKTTIIATVWALILTAGRSAVKVVWEKFLVPKLFPENGIIS